MYNEHSYGYQNINSAYIVECKNAPISFVSNMTELDNVKERKSIRKFIDKIIWQASLANRRKSSVYPFNRPDSDNKVPFLTIFEQALDVFTKKDYRWQIYKNEDLVPYVESERRIIILLFILVGITLMTCNIMTAIVAITFSKETSKNSTLENNHLEANSTKS